MAKLNKKMLVKLEKKMNEEIAVSYSIKGEVVDVTIKTYTSDPDIEKYTGEFLVLSDYAKENGKHILDETLTVMLLLKHMTDLPFERNIDTDTSEVYEDLVTTCETLRVLIDDVKNETLFSLLVKEVDKYTNRMLETVKKISEYHSK